ncbi:NlpC/P60 family protein [Streptomyces xanthochromogenes]|uniref:C40 family peptidase n=1 Tax=Streptomyces xanthochromogenes TaxID=67384 RepID=UPI00341C881D
MGSHRRPRQAGRARVTVLTATAAAAVALSSQAAEAAPAKPSKAEVKSKVDALYHQAEKATDEYNGANEKQAALQKEVTSLQEEAARRQADLNSLRTSIGSLASAQYRTGGIDPAVALFLSANPDTYLDKASSMDQLGGRQAEALRTLQAKQRVLAQKRAEATRKTAELSDVRKTVGERKKAYQGKLAEAQKLLNSLTAAERTELQQEEKRASRSAGERVDLGQEKPASGRGYAALQAAATQIGKPYQSGHEGPDSYDCSGLTQWAFGQVNVHISRVTFTQINEGSSVSFSQLAPGDLVFFNNLQHVGFYAGNGMVLHAPKPGASVRYEKMSYLGSFYGARRI